MADKWYKWDTSQAPASGYPKSEAAMQLQIRDMGMQGFLDAYPQIFTPNYKWYEDLIHAPTTGVVAGAPTTSQALNQAIMGAWGGTGGTQGGEVWGRGEREQMQINALSELMGQFGGLESTWIRWLIGEEIKELEFARDKDIAAGMAYAKEYYKGIGEAEQAAQEQGTYTETVHYKSSTQEGDADIVREGVDPAYLEAAGGEMWGAGGQTGVGAERIAIAEQMRIPEVMQRAPAGSPMPDWMLPYVDYGNPYAPATKMGTLGARGGIPTTVLTGSPKAGQLRPAGAQAELTADDMATMAGYQAWGKAGAPTSYSQSAVQQMANWQKWWEPYAKLSQKLFPAKVGLGKRWAAGRQY